MVSVPPPDQAHGQVTCRTPRLTIGAVNGQTGRIPHGNVAGHVSLDGKSAGGATAPTGVLL